MGDRLQTVFGHLAPDTRRASPELFAQNTAALPNWQNKPDDIVVVACRRTAIAKAKRGSFKVFILLFFECT